MKNNMNYDELWAEHCKEESIRCSPDYWDGRAEDYSDFILNSDFDHGRKILSLFQNEEIFSQSWNILDIGSGPGAITIPFAQAAASVTSVEPAGQMVGKLSENASKKNLSNITVIQDIWQNIGIDELEKKFDLAICCHSVWHFPDLFSQIERMHQVSRRYCCIAHGVQPLAEKNSTLKKMGISDGDADRFQLVKQILENRGIFPNVSILPIKMKRTVESARAMLTLGLKKYREPSSEDIILIEEDLALHQKNGMYEKEGYMGVLWWRVS